MGPTGDPFSLSTATVKVIKGEGDFQEERRLGSANISQGLPATCLCFLRI